jgi:predicted small lipoprotein YifL
MYKNFLKLLFILISLSLISACGVKGKLEHPDEVEGKIYER